MAKSGALDLPTKPKKYHSDSPPYPNRSKKDSFAGRKKLTPTPFDDDDDDLDGVVDDDDDTIDTFLEAIPEVNSNSLNRDKYLEDDEVGEPLDLAAMGEGGRASTKALTVFPAPPSFKMGWDKFSTYWKQCYDMLKVRPRMKVYIYRMFPVMKEGHRRVDILSGAPEFGEQDAKPLSIQEILHRYGSGDYHFKINDAGANSRQIAQCDLVNRSQMRDYDTHFPILDLEGLDEHDPINRTFLKQLRQRGKAGLLSEDDEMQTTQLLTSMMDRVLDANKDKGTAPDPSGNEALKLMGDATRAAMQLVTDTKRQLQSEQPSTPQAPAVNPLEMVTALVTVAEKLRPDNTTLIEALRAASAREEAASARYNELLGKMMEQSIARTQEQDKKDDDPIAKLVKLAESKELLADILGVRGNKSAGTDWAAVAQAAAPMLGPVLQSVQAMAMGFMYRMAGPGAAPNPQQGQQNPQQALPGAPGAAAGSGVGVGVPPGSPNAPGASQQPDASQDGLGGVSQQELLSMGVPIELTTAAGAQQYLDNLTGPLLRILNNKDLTGEDFANWLIDWKGEEHYLRIAAAGKETIFQLLCQHPPLAQDLVSRPQMVSQFLDEFLSVAQAQDDDGDGDDDDQGDGQGSQASDPAQRVQDQAVRMAANGAGMPQPQQQTKPVDPEREAAREAARQERAAKRAALKDANSAARKPARKPTAK